MSKSLWFVMTRKCNFDCSYCYQGSHQWKWQKDAGLQKHMTDDVMSKTLDFLLEWADEHTKIIFYGGEPLLQFELIKKWVPIYKQMFEVQNSKTIDPSPIKKRLDFSVTTNGSLLNGEVREFLDEHGIGVLLSLDGPPWIHDKQRTYYGDRASWDTIPLREILDWRPLQEIAWQVDPDRIPTADDIDWMIEFGFKRINFNINWLKEWDAQARLDMMEFARAVGRRAIRGAKDGSFGSNLLQKFNEIILKDDRQTQPCGTGMMMMAVTPEGWLYPSQEMAFTVVEPHRAEGTAEYYRLGNIYNDPVIDQERLKVVSTIRNDEMRQPEGFNCNNCAARPISFGGCHCRYVGADGVDPSNRYDVLPGWCQSEQAWVTGFAQAALIERYLTFRVEKPVQIQKPKHQHAGVQDVYAAVKRVESMLQNLDIVKLEGVE